MFKHPHRTELIIHARILLFFFSSLCWCLVGRIAFIVAGGVSEVWSSRIVLPPSCVRVEYYIKPLLSDTDWLHSTGQQCALCTRNFRYLIRSWLWFCGRDAVRNRRNTKSTNHGWKFFWLCWCALSFCFLFFVLSHSDGSSVCLWLFREDNSQKFVNEIRWRMPSYSYIVI